jgi:hypothetical protein
MHQLNRTHMKKLIVFSTIILSLFAFSVSAATVSHGHKYKHHKVSKHHHHADPSYQN